MTTNKTLYILLTDTGTVLPKLIKWYTKKRYNHVSISFDESLREVYSFGRKHMKNPFSGGFVRENTREGLFKEASCAVYSITITEKQLDKIQNYIKMMEENKDCYRYNFLGLFGFMFQRPIKRDNALFCSQFVATALQLGGVLEKDKEPALTTPSDIQEHEALELVYEGKLNQYLEEEKIEFFNISPELESVYV